MSTSSEDFKQRHNRDMELARRELERKSHDIIRVYNPLDHTFRFMQNRYWHSIPAKSYKDMERYLARHYFKKVCDFMIGQQISVKGEELKALREKQMGKQFLDHYEENVQIWDRQPRLNDPELIEQIKQVVIVGLVEEYGMEAPEPEMQVPDEPFDIRPLHERIFGDVDKRVTAADAPLPNEQTEIESILSKSEEKLSPLTPLVKNSLAQEVSL